MRTFGISSILLSLTSLYTTTSALPIDSHPPTHHNETSPYSYPNPYQNPHPHPETTPTARPAIARDFPDPAFIKLSDGYYAFSTSSNGHNIQVAKSTSFSKPSWSVFNTDALPDPGAWTDRSHNIWAPYVYQTPSGSFVMYYAAPPSQDSSKHCVGTATSKSITGPYTPSSSPFACDLSIGGAIDPSIFKDPKTGYLYVTYKIDGNSLGGSSHPTPIMLQQINASDGVTKIGSATKIFDQDPNSDADGPLVEAPSVMYANGVYFLLFSTHVYNTEEYDWRYTTSSSIKGPFSKTQNVLLRTGDGNGVVAPGSGDVHDGMMVFHGSYSLNPLVRYMYAGYVQAQGSTLRYTGSAV